MDNIAAISVDLDDTLWPAMPVILRAEQRLYEWFAARCPRVTEMFSPQDLGNARARVVEANPGRAHDFAFLRRALIAQALGAAGYPASLTETAYQVFSAARNEVDVFDDVVPALTRLRERFVLLAVTNGTADLTQIGLAAFFAHTIRAADVGAGKPDPRVFAAVCRATRLPPERVMHVGDAPVDDIAGATRMGMPTVWVNRFERRWPADQPQPTLQVRELSELDRFLSVV